MSSVDEFQTQPYQYNCDTMFNLCGNTESQKFWNISNVCWMNFLQDSWYSNVLYLGNEDEVPILTMT
jgi:hypothetical protein